MEAVRKEWSTGEMLAGTNRSWLVRGILLLLNVLLALLVWLTWQTPPLSSSAMAVEHVQKPPLQLPSSPLRRLSFAHYQELVDRPLFWSERRALATEQTVDVAAPMHPMTFVLIGVVMSPQSKHALLSKPGAKEVTKVQEGDIVEGWQVEVMSADSVRLTRGSEHQLLSLDEKRAGAK